MDELNEKYRWVWSLLKVVGVFVLLLALYLMPLINAIRTKDNHERNPAGLIMIKGFKVFGHDFSSSNESEHYFLGWPLEKFYPDWLYEYQG